MRLSQLHQYLGDLLASGLDPDTVVCVIEMHADTPSELVELTDADLRAGPFLEDPSPKMCGFLSSTGRTLTLFSGSMDDRDFDDDHEREMTSIDLPSKTWPHGPWWQRPRVGGA